MLSVGFIGVGNMGSYMARNLMRNGMKLVVCDVDSSRVAQLKVIGIETTTFNSGHLEPAEREYLLEFYWSGGMFLRRSAFDKGMHVVLFVGSNMNEICRAEGAEVVQRPADVAMACERIVTMLPSSPHVLKVFTADDGILSMMKSGTLCVDSSTIDQSVSLDIAKRVATKGGYFVDAPVSGGIVGAQNATLTFMVGGDETSFREANEILKFMGKNIIHCGKVGSGQATKICNNMLLGIQMIGVAETMNLGIKMGLDAKQLASIINTSSGRCWSSDTYNPVPGVIEGIPPSNAYIGGFGCTLMAKDLGLAQNASTAVQAPTPLGSLAHQLYRMLAKSPQYNKLDFGVIYQFLKDQ